MFDWKEFDKWQTALCCWREARGEGRDGQRAVVHVIANRSALSGRSWAQEVYRKLQFSSMTYGNDPQLCTVPVTPDAIFSTCYEIADAVMSGQDTDITLGATHYFNPNIVLPSWAEAFTKTVSIGHHDFFKGAYS